MKLLPITGERYGDFHRLLTDYYRDGADAETPQETLDEFIEMLFGLCREGTIGGAMAYETAAVGFVLWGMDTEDFPFSNLPGYGTILEIGVVPTARGRGLGRYLAEYAEQTMGIGKYYVCVYDPAEKFWQNCRYRDSGRVAQNGLKIFRKE